MKHSFKVFLDEDLYNWLQEEAARRYCPMSGVIRHLLSEEIQRQKREKEGKTAVLYRPSSS